MRSWSPWRFGEALAARATILLAIALAPAPSRAEVVDRLVAVVASEPLLLSDIRLEAALAVFDPSPVPFWRSAPLPDPAIPDRDLLRAIDAMVMRNTASDVALYQPTREQTTARVLALQAAFGAADDPDRQQERWERFLTIHGLDAARLESVVRRRMVTERYLLRNLQADPSDTEAWTRECQAMIGTLRSRTRVRTIEAPEETSSPTGSE